MANLRAGTDAAFGLQPYTAPLRQNSYAKGATVNIFRGDIVVALSSGLAASMTDPALGLVIGVAAETSLSASAATSIMVYDHPDQLYVCQDDDVGTAIAQTHFGNIGNVTGLTPGTAAQVTRGQSIMQLDTSTLTAALTSPLPLQFIKLHEIETVAGNTFPTSAGSPRKVVVHINSAYSIYATQSGAI